MTSADGPNRSAHGHLWLLADGTPAHAPPGRLTYNEDGQLACHLCGRWFDHLGLHLRKHGWSAEDYRAAVGLARSRALCAGDISATIRRRQRRNWRREPQLRQRLQTGQKLAASGELTELATAAHRARIATTGVAAETARNRNAALARGRSSMAMHRRVELERWLAAEGYRDLADYLHRAYADGASLADLARTTGLGRDRLRSALTAAGVEVRAVGQNVSARKRLRADRNDAELAGRLGVQDIRPWLHEQYESGSTLRALATMTGRSIPWVRSRLNPVISTGSPDTARTG